MACADSYLAWHVGRELPRLSFLRCEQLGNDILYLQMSMSVIPRVVSPWWVLPKGLEYRRMNATCLSISSFNELSKNVYK